MNKIELDIKGMHCKGCELGLEDKLEELEFIQTAKADFKKGKVKISYDKDSFNMEKVCDTVKSLGFEVVK